MSEYIAVPLMFTTTVIILIFGLGYMIRKDMEDQQTRFEQCLAAGMQWHKGDCLK